MLDRREFYASPRNLYVRASMLAIFMLICIGLSFIQSTDDDLAGATAALRFIGTPAFGVLAALFFLLAYRMSRMRRPIIVLAADGFYYGGLRIEWPVIRDAVVLRYLFQRFAAIRTINDSAVRAKLRAVIANKSAGAAALMSVRSARCAFALPTISGMSAAEVCAAINEYRSKLPEPPKN